jgi:hypothetical protein
VPTHLPSTTPHVRVPRSSLRAVRGLPTE